MSGKIYQGSHLVAQTNDAPLGFEDKGIELESLAQYEQLEKDGNLQEDVNYYIKDTKLVMRNNEKYGTSINDSVSSASTTYSSSKIEEINTPVWSGTTSEFEALDKTTLKDGQVVNITDDYDEPNTKDVYSLSEVKTNKVWIDGKPIYRTVAHTTIPNDSNKYVIQEFDGTNIDRLITLYGGVKQVEGSNQTIISFYRDTTDGLFLYFDNALKRLCAKSNTIGGGDAYIVIEYTKTTD